MMICKDMKAYEGVTALLTTQPGRSGKPGHQTGVWQGKLLAVGHPDELRSSQVHVLK